VYPVVTASAPDTVTSMVVYWSGLATGKAALSRDGPNWYGSIGPVTSRVNGTIQVWVEATNKQGGTTQLQGTPVEVCPVVIIR